MMFSDAVKELVISLGQYHAFTWTTGRPGRTYCLCVGVEDAYAHPELVDYINHRITMHFRVDYENNFQPVYCELHKIVKRVIPEHTVIEYIGVSNG